MEIKTAKFMLSVADIEHLLGHDKPEIAFVGRSNVGKSSLINSLTRHSGLAKTSSLPGRTRLLNYFLINENLVFVDLPGYGFHKAGKKSEEMWANLLEGYLLKSQNLKLVFLLLDLRHEPNDDDKIMLRFLYQQNIPFKIIATKADKIAKSKQIVYATKISTSLGLAKNDVCVFQVQDELARRRVLELIEKYVEVRL